jgi:uncharacterized membrane-anchored protein YjiN (DUF445 family)
MPRCNAARNSAGWETGAAMVSEAMIASPDRVRTPTPDADQPARLALARQKRRATALLGGMGGLTVAGYALADAYGQGYWTGLLQATAKAGLVGGLADWFAVTALFRHPLGLPIPHTAIIPAQKERLGRALGGFVATHVFTDADMETALAGIDLPAALAGMLRDPRVSDLLGRGLVKLVPPLLDGLEAGRIADIMTRLAPGLMSDGQLAPVVAKALRALVDGDRHQEVLSFLLGQIKQMLKQREAHLHQLIEDRVREQGGRLLGWAIGGSIADRVLSAINLELDRTDPHDSGLREAVTVWMRQEIDLIETDPERARDLGETLRGLFTHDSLRLWSADVWSRARGVIETDIADEDGWVRGLATRALDKAVRSLETDTSVRQAVSNALLTLATRGLPGVRERLSGFIASVVAGWNTRLLTERLELRIGPDLQYVRINGTLVGALVGGALYVGLKLVFGAVETP